MGRAKWKRIAGECHICGRKGRLSFEHVPPQAAFNDRAIVGLSGERALREYRRGRPKGRPQQRGAGGHTLCERCNSRTGSWYGAALVEWYRQAAALLNETKGEPTLAYPYYVYPLRVLKEVVSMFFSINDVAFRNGRTVTVCSAGRDLAQFVLNRDRRSLPTPFRVFAYFTTLRYSRSAGWSLVQEGMRTHNLTEVTFPPFGFVMTGEGDPPHRNMEEITAWGNYSYDDFRMVHLRLPVLTVASPYPGDYRTEEEVAAAQEIIVEVPETAGQPTSLRLVRVKEQT